MYQENLDFSLQVSIFETARFLPNSVKKRTASWRMYILGAPHAVAIFSVWSPECPVPPEKTTLLYSMLFNVIFISLISHIINTNLFVLPHFIYRVFFCFAIIFFATFFLLTDIYIYLCIHL